MNKTYTFLLTVMNQDELTGDAIEGVVVLEDVLPDDLTHLHGIILYQFAGDSRGARAIRKSLQSAYRVMKQAYQNKEWVGL